MSDVLKRLKELSSEIHAMSGRKYKRRRNTGATEEKMRRKLARPIAECIFGVPTDAQVESVFKGTTLYPAKGYWTHVHQDVMAFTGYIKLNDAEHATYDIGSWSSMTKCLRQGFRLIDNRGDGRAYCTFECDPLD